MTITINQVSVERVPTAKGGYNKAIVSYVDQGGRDKTQNILEFANKQVYGVVTKAKPGEQFEITTVTNAKGYLEWSSITPATGGSTSAVPSAPSVSKPVSSTYETKEERAVRQRLIVRQSSLTAALATLSPGSKGPLDPDAVEALAERYSAFVFKEPSLLDEPSDIPF